MTTGQQGIAPDGRVVLHAQPTCFTINGKVPVKKPAGMHADLLGVDIHVVLADGAPPVCAILRGIKPEEAIDVSAALVEATSAPKETVRVWITEVPKTNWGIAGVTAKDLGR